MDSLLFWLIFSLVCSLLFALLVLYIIINFWIIKRNFNILLYFLIPSVLSIVLFLVTRSYLSWLNIYNWLEVKYLAFNLFSAFTTVFALWRLIKFIVVIDCIRLYTKFINFIDEKKFVIVVDGFFGAGKSSMTSEYCALLSEIMWERIKYNYWLLRNIKHKFKDNKKLELDLKDNETAYNYWQANKDYYPCLFSNIGHYDLNNKLDSGMTVSGQKVKKFNFKMLNQKEIIPYGSVVHAEELGDWIGNEFSDKDGKALLEGVSRVVGRYPRHYGDFHFVINDQDCNNLFINIRRGASLNQLMIKQVWVCRPRFLIFIQNVFKWFIVKFNYRNNKLLARFMYSLEKFIKSIGFRKYWSELRGNTQNGVTDHTGKFIFTIPSRLLSKFDDRYKRTEYTIEDTEAIEREQEQVRQESLTLAKNVYKKDDLPKAIKRYKDTIKLSEELQKDEDLKTFTKSLF